MVKKLVIRKSSDGTGINTETIPNIVELVFRDIQ